MTAYPKLKIAGVQADVDFDDPRTNLKKLISLTKKAVQSSSRYVVFPECFLTGYCYDSVEQMEQACLDHSDPIFSEIAIFSGQLNIAISAGSLYRDESGSHYNSVLTWDCGKLVNLYHKTHLPFLGVDRFVSPGPTLAPLFEIDSVKIGVHICYEGGFPEIGRSLSLQGADLLVLPTNWPPGSGVSCDAIPACRSLENKVYFMAVNRIGTEQGTPFIGNSSITDCVGKIVDSAQGSEERILLAEIDTKHSREKKVVHTAGVYEVDRIEDRRPEQYDVITKPKKDLPISR